MTVSLFTSYDERMQPFHRMLTDYDLFIASTMENPADRRVSLRIKEAFGDAACWVSVYPDPDVKVMQDAVEVQLRMKGLIKC